MMSGLIDNLTRKMTAKQAALNILDAEMEKLEAAGQTNSGKRDHALWSILYEASMKTSTEISVLRIRIKNISKRRV